MGRIGFNIGKDINEKTNIYLKANLMHEFGNAGYNASMVDASGTKARLDRNFDDTWFEYGLGAAVQTGKNNYFYVDVERSAGSDYKRLAVECRRQMEFLNSCFDFRCKVLQPSSLLENIQPPFHFYGTEVCLSTGSN